MSITKMVVSMATAGKSIAISHLVALPTTTKITKVMPCSDLARNLGPFFIRN
jgi:hypothetical protein